MKQSPTTDGALGWRARNPRRQGLALNKIRPTERQIAENIAVIPKAFLDENIGKLDPRAFAVVFLGEALTNRRLDSERRVSLPLRGRVQDGAVLTLSVQAGALHVTAQ